MQCDGASPCGRCRADNAICVFGERKKAHDKVYPKGYVHPVCPTIKLTSVVRLTELHHRYVEMLEQQQVWLVNGLQEMYRRAQEGEGWDGEPLKAETNGHPLTHDLLTRLGALDHSKGEQFEEDVELMQQRLWQQNAGYMQRQESSDGSSDIAHSPISSSNNNSTMSHRHPSHHHHNNHRHHPYNVSGFADAISRHQLPPTPPSYSPSSQSMQMPVIKSEQAQHPATTTTNNNNNPNFSATVAATSLLLSQQGINPMALQNPQNLRQQQQQQQTQAPWAGNNSNNNNHNMNDLSFDDLDLLGNQYTLFEDSTTPSSPPPMFATRQQQQQSQQQMPISCLPPSMLFDTNDDFSQYFNANTEISTI